MGKSVFYVILIFSILFVSSGQSQSSEKIANQKIKELKKLIQALEKLNIEAFKEELAIATAEEFLKYANWDEKNIKENTEHFKQINIYKDSALVMAQKLPEFERNDIIKLLDETIEVAELLISGKIKRTPYVRPDWSQIVIDGNRLLYRNKPVFLHDYTWKPSTPKLSKYFGGLNNFLINPNQLKTKNGDLNSNVLQRLKEGSSNNAGFVFISHKDTPQWAEEVYGTELDKIMGKPFTSYDIDNPGARDMLSKLFKATVPYLADKKHTQLGYMLANEPRWANYSNGNKNVWFRADVSKYTLDKFETWLHKRHETIEKLNLLWETNMSDFNEVALQLPVDLSERGTAKWYDWTTFNQERVTEWFTFMKSEIRKYDPQAKAHLKVMPSIFTDNDPDSGVDWEALTELSEINGNDAASHYNTTKPNSSDWDDNYAWGWRELFMGYDFLKSIQPNQINFNSESHLLSGSHVRDLYMNPKYVRAAYWSAHILGLNATQTWFWPRRPDGSLRPNSEKGYAGSNNQQPRVTFELENTILDLNRFSEEITAFQQQRKPIRLYYSKTSASQNADYMNKTFGLYESLNFEGIPLGFATENIIKRIDNKEWEVILIYETQQVTIDELQALQYYLDNGGTIITDEISLKTDAYGASLPALDQSKGKLLVVSTLQEMKGRTLSLLQEKELLPAIEIIENDGESAKKCIWRVIENDKGNHVLSVVNVGKHDVTLNFRNRKTNRAIAFKELISDIPIKFGPVLKPYEVLFIEELKN
ncbi:beta-galactosidase [Gelidibacter salicanalis]|uniref:Beta-galactosidase n=1 Tax=Gelidibacter salicanalis TaxID=291193 RepID=A0A934KUE4_9FLAO|nr:beta-galactosidase [Gelidibacter salicanalis]MBJ7881546.1 beta-galactosidase [Gelidibacter salicanalis]